MFDGVAVIYNGYAAIKCSNGTARTAFLDNLSNIVTIIRSTSQDSGKLSSHYSVGWDWGQCNGSSIDIIWNNKTQNVYHHVIDMFDSVDIQVRIGTCMANQMHYN